MKNIPLFLALTLFTATLSGCGNVTNQKISYCYEFIDDPKAMVVITPQGEEISDKDGSTIFFDTVSIIDPEGEQKTAGEIRADSFYYADGSKWTFSTTEAVGFGGLIEGMRAKAVSCP